MQVVGQNDDRIDGERVFALYFGERVAQQIDVIGEQIELAIQQVDGEEICACGHPASSVVGHLGMIVYCGGFGGGFRFTLPALRW